LANAVPKKVSGVGSSDGWNKSCATRAEEVDDEVPMRHLGSMWQGHISEHEQICSSRAPLSKSSTSGKIWDCASLTQWTL
jgi:hypothetical protein